MITPKEQFLKHVRNDNPEWMGDPFTCLNTQPTPPGLPYFLDATATVHGRATKGQVNLPDAWGVIWDWPADQPGATPDTAGDKKVIKDITRWREFFEFPSLDNLDWTATKALEPSIDRENKLLIAHSPRGLFEFSHAMMGFEDALENYLLEPDDMYELLSAYTDWKIKAAELSIDNFKPDAISNHDDWGSKHQLFLPPRVWREILKPLNERFFGYIKSRGVININHCDCYAQDICTDMVEIGIDVWQGVTPQNDIPAIVSETGGELLLFGGLDMPSIDYPGVTEEVVRAHVREMMDKYVPTKHLIPMFPSWMPLYPGVKEWACDEMDKHGAVLAKQVFG
ncbi:MAG: methyltransferase [Oscillospiraceae bacterium]|nr:methyltransferase [Oscillospiraceae bacterium]